MYSYFNKFVMKYIVIELRQQCSWLYCIVYYFLL